MIAVIFEFIPAEGRFPEYMSLVDTLRADLAQAEGFLSLERADPQQLSSFILAEHPQTIALILAHLNPMHAAQLATGDIQIAPRGRTAPCSGGAANW